MKLYAMAKVYLSIYTNTEYGEESGPSRTTVANLKMPQDRAYCSLIGFPSHWRNVLHAVLEDGDIICTPCQHVVDPKFTTIPTTLTIYSKGRGTNLVIQ